MNRLSTEPALGGREFRVDVEGSVVTLYGSVHGIDSWNCAIRTAQMVEGVRTVVEFLMIESGPSPVPCSLGSAR